MHTDSVSDIFVCCSRSKPKAAAVQDSGALFGDDATEEEDLFSSATKPKPAKVPAPVIIKIQAPFKIPN